MGALGQRRSAGVVGCVGGQARIVPAVVAKVRCRVYGSAMTSR
ncbi:hypothetical protein CSC45_1465 [Pseudomonas aeruginosa]|nr:hypothetical protein CSC41_3117 [Pseudomonas aeruginosa]RCH36193.1 hypothetical protein CSC45_1465 [Pseudomonas aeruginosa]